MSEGKGFMTTEFFWEALLLGRQAEFRKISLPESVDYQIPLAQDNFYEKWHILDPFMENKIKM